jgi:hypothetical protein
MALATTSVTHFFTLAFHLHKGGCLTFTLLWHCRHHIDLHRLPVAQRGTTSSPVCLDNLVELQIVAAVLHSRELQVPSEVFWCPPSHHDDFDVGCELPADIRCHVSHPLFPLQPSCIKFVIESEVWLK